MNSSEIAQNTLGATLLAVTWMLLAMSFIVVGLRLYSDIAILRFVRPDSYIITFAYVSLQDINSMRKTLLIARDSC